VRRRAEPYLGKIPGRWLGRAAALPGKALAAGLALWLEASCKRSACVTLLTSTRQLFGLTSRYTLWRALKALEAAGLIRVEGRPGAHSRITILDVPRGETP
jgi:hypothetical protein